MKSIFLSLALLAGMAVATTQVMAQEAAPQQPAAAEPQSQTPAAAQPQSQTPTAQQPSSSDMQKSGDTMQGDNQSFTGKISKEGSKYVLKVAGTSYELDNQDQAKQFEGKEVKVTGKLDTASNTLHVQNIEPAK